MTLRLVTISFLLFLAQIGLSGCQTDEIKQYQMLTVGMDKDAVLGIMGSPRHTERVSGRDKWTYIFYQNGQWNSREIEFEDGKANYVGEVRKPELTATEQDVKNEAANKTADENLIQQKEESRKDYSKYEDSVTGSKEIRFVPEFKPVE